MKKIILAIVLAVMLFVIVGCNSPKEEVKVEIGRASCRERV